MPSALIAPPDNATIADIAIVIAGMKTLREALLGIGDRAIELVAEHGQRLRHVDAAAGQDGVQCILQVPLAGADALRLVAQLVIDRAAPSVTKDARFPFFDGDELSADTQKMVNFCSQVEGERQRSKEPIGYRGIFENDPGAPR